MTPHGKPRHDTDGSQILGRFHCDLADFSGVMVEKFFAALSASCRRVDPNHLDLAIRYHTIPPPWAVVAGMRSFDVFSMNCYDAPVRAAEVEKIAAMLGMPVMVGEWHFGALDAGLPASGIGHVRIQEDRGRAYRVSVEDAVSKPWCGASPAAVRCAAPGPLPAATAEVSRQT